MMAVGDLTDLATARAACNISSPTTATDPILQTYISAISAYIPSVLNRNVLLSNYTEFYTGNGKSRMLLRGHPVQSITAVTWQGAPQLSAGDPILGTTGFWTDGWAVQLVNALFPLGQPVQVSYSAGYSTVPLDMSLAVAELVAEAYARRTHVGETSRSQGGQITTSFDPKAMHNAIASKLANYVAVAPC